MAEPYYTTADDLRTELGVDATALPDADAAKLIATAENLIDAKIAQPTDSNGDTIPLDATTGRRVTESTVDAWRWDKLSRATVLVAADLYSSPDVAKGRQWQSERGPEFAFSGPLGDDLGAEVVALLAATGWYPGRTASARVGSVADDLPALYPQLRVPPIP